MTQIYDMGLTALLPLKIRRLRPGLNTRTWVLKASTLPLDHRIRYKFLYTPQEGMAFTEPILRYLFAHPLYRILTKVDENRRKYREKSIHVLN